MILTIDRLPKRTVSPARLATFDRYHEVQEVRVGLDDYLLETACRLNNGDVDMTCRFDEFILVTEAGVEAYCYERLKPGWTRVYPRDETCDPFESADEAEPDELVAVARTALDEFQQSAATVHELQVDKARTEKRYDGFRRGSDLR